MAGNIAVRSFERRCLTQISRLIVEEIRQSSPATFVERMDASSGRRPVEAGNRVPPVLYGMMTCPPLAEASPFDCGGTARSSATLQPAGGITASAGPTQSGTTAWLVSISGVRDLRPCQYRRGRWLGPRSPARFCGSALRVTKLLKCWE